MTPAKPTILELAKQGNPKAIEALLNRNLQPKDITAKVALKDNCLQIMLESTQILNQQSLVSFINKGLTTLELTYIKVVKIYGQQANQNTPTWSEEILIGSSERCHLTENIEQNSPDKSNSDHNIPETPLNQDSNPETAKKLVEESNHYNTLGCWALICWALISMLGQCSSSSPSPDTSGCLGNYCWESQEQLERDVCRVDPSIRGCR